MPAASIGVLDVAIVGLAGAVALAGGWLFVRSRRAPPPATDDRHPDAPDLGHPERTPPPDGLDALRDVDAELSRAGLRTYARALARATTHAAVYGGWEALAPFVSDDMAARISGELGSLLGVGDVVVARADPRLLSLERVALIEIDVVGHRVEHGAHGPARVRFHERWTLQRAATAPSVPPDVIGLLRCPTCQRPVALDVDGCCTGCGEPQKWGHHQWQIVEWRPQPRTPLEALPLMWRHTGYTAPLWVEQHLDRRLTEVQRTHPDFELEAILDRVRAVHHAVLTDTRADGLARIRGLVGDVVWDQLHHEVAQHAVEGWDLRRRAVDLHELVPVWLDRDGPYLALTVRLWWKMIELVVDADELVVEGDVDAPVVASQYWTFVRQGPSAKPGYTGGCPSCGASLDQTDATGRCTACDVVVTDGSHAWILAYIADVGDLHPTGSSSGTG